MTQPHNFKPGLMTIRDSQKLNELQKWIDNRRAALAIPANAFPPSYKFQAKITAYSSDDYSWTRQAFDVDGEYIDDPVPYSGGPSDMPAKERNGKIAVDFPFYAELTFRVNVQGSPYYEFDYTTVDRITIKEVDGSPSVLAKTLELPNSAMSNPSTGVARLLEASSTTGGTVTLSAQTMGDGVKTFKDPIYINSDFSTAPASATIYGPSAGGLSGAFGLPIRITNQYDDPTAAVAGTEYVDIQPGTEELNFLFQDTSSALGLTQFSFLVGTDSGSRRHDFLFSCTFGAGHHSPRLAILNASGSVVYGDTGALGPGATFVGGVCDYVGSGSFGTAAAEDIGTSGGTVPLLNGNNTYSGSANFADAFYLSGDITPAQLTANTNNWSPTGW